ASNGAAEHRITLAILELALLPAVPELPCKYQAPAREFDGVRAQVTLVNARIDGHGRVFVGCEGQRRLTAARGDLVELASLGFRRDLLVPIFDGPVVVWAQRRHAIRALMLAFEREIDSVVFHDRTRNAVVLGELRIVQLRLRVYGRC